MVASKKIQNINFFVVGLGVTQFFFGGVHFLEEREGVNKISRKKNIKKIGGGANFGFFGGG